MSPIRWSQEATFKGHLRPVETPDRILSMRLDSRFVVEKVADVLRTRTIPFEGTLTCEDLATNQAVSGSVHFDTWESPSWSCAFDFKGPNDETLRYRAESHVALADLQSTLGTLQARLTSTQGLVATGVLSMNLRGLAKMLSSTRPVF